MPITLLSLMMTNIEREKNKQWNFGYLSHTFHQNGRKKKKDTAQSSQGKAGTRV